MTNIACEEIPVDSTPAHEILQTSGHYRLRLAKTDEDLDAIFSLRFRVFNLELNEGLETSYATGLDRDQFDAHCAHLIVEDQRSLSIVGTYRMQDRKMARAGAGFYSAGEFCLETLGDDILDQAVELGRACIDEAHRNTRVLFLLWRGLAAYMVSRQHRYFFGCCSLTSQDPAEGIALHERLVQQGSCDESLSVVVQPAYACVADHPYDGPTPRVPKLMRLYLSYGARIVSGPALDQEFSTIDYLALFDLQALDAEARRMFVDD
ncbi:MAG: GNAT family N-acetyltransferase [Woeseiaceae bacterium]